MRPVRLPSEKWVHVRPRRLERPKERVRAEALGVARHVPRRAAADERDRLDEAGRRIHQHYGAHGEAVGNEAIATRVPGDAAEPGPTQRTRDGEARRRPDSESVGADQRALAVRPNGARGARRVVDAVDADKRGHGIERRRQAGRDSVQVRAAHREARKNIRALLVAIRHTSVVCRVECRRRRVVEQHLDDQTINSNVGNVERVAVRGEAVRLVEACACADHSRFVAAAHCVRGRTAAADKEAVHAVGLRRKSRHDASPRVRDVERAVGRECERRRRRQRRVRRGRIEARERVHVPREDVNATDDPVESVCDKDGVAGWSERESHWVIKKRRPAHTVVSSRVTPARTTTREDGGPTLNARGVVHIWSGRRRRERRGRKRLCHESPFDVTTCALPRRHRVVTAADIEEVAAPAGGQRRRTARGHRRAVAPTVGDYEHDLGSSSSRTLRLRGAAAAACSPQR